MKNGWRSSKFYEWFIRKKLYHLPLWILYEIGMSAIFSDQMKFDWQSLIILVSFTLAHATAAYTNIYYLIPRFLHQKKYIKYVLGFFLNLTFSPFIIIVGFLIAFEFNQDTISLFFTSDMWFPTVYASSYTAVFVVMIIKMSKEWVATQQKNQRLEKEKLETELKFLRSQFNPHFLFNAINSIFFLIQKDQEQATNALAKFSDLLRYQLYECNEPKIDLKKEITYLENFIELEKLRQEKTLEIKFGIENKDDFGGKIAPFLLIPFIENAFKHVSKNTKDRNYIHACIHIKGETFFLQVINSTQELTEKSEEVNPYKGIGLENVRRRLTLLYPKKHELKIEHQESEFKVQLNLELC